MTHKLINIIIPLHLCDGNEVKSNIRTIKIFSVYKGSNIINVMCHHLLSLCTSFIRSSIFDQSSSKGKGNTVLTELTSDQSPVFHCGQRNSLQGWTVSLSLWLHLLSSPPASAAFRHTAPRRRVPPPQLLEHWSTNIWTSTSGINLW